MLIRTKYEVLSISINPEMFTGCCLHLVTEFPHPTINPLAVTILSEMEQTPGSNRRLSLMKAGAAIGRFIVPDV